MCMYKVSSVSHRPLKVQDLTMAAAEAAANIYRVLEARTDAVLWAVKTHLFSK